VEGQLADQLSRRSVSPDARGMLLYVTIGHAAYLATDGSVWLEGGDEDPGSVQWSLAKPVERIGALFIATKYYPELQELLPPRPSDAPTCTQCAGRGHVFAEVVCPSCGGLGWVSDEAA